MGLLSFLSNVFEAGSWKGKLRGRPANSDSSGAIGYDPKLVAKFAKEHRDLIASWDLILDLVMHDRLSQAQGQMSIFGMALKAHLAIEDARFYAYMEHEMCKDLHAMATINEFKAEMAEVGKALNKFLDTYTRPRKEWTADQSKALPKMLAEISVALHSRVDREESTLYPLYYP